MRRSEDLGRRKHARVDFERPAFLILEPAGPWIECSVADISHGGARLKVGGLALPQTFLLLLTPGGEVRRICRPIWRWGEEIGVRFVTRKQLLDPYDCLASN
ncbi:PilZ domain-containing protein [Bradyrhizobium sp.]|uniref:PilZ domain-containing protein n=1 Tax=Bradyrhizobium sp. TaxID=376 RepID=UPI003C43897F